MTNGRWKTRYWVCDRCGIVLRRYLTQTGHVHCHQPMRSARTYPNAAFFKRINRLYDKQRAARALLNKKYSRCWNSEGHILQTSKETRRIWKVMSRLQHRDAFARHGKNLLESLRKDLGKNGSQGVPEIVYEKMNYTLGMYRRSWTKGWNIVLAPGHDMKEIKDTFLHELLHWIDDQASCGNNFGKLPNDHFQYEPRLADLKLRLGIRSVKPVLPLRTI